MTRSVEWLREVVDGLEAAMRWRTPAELREMRRDVDRLARADRKASER